MNLRSVAVLLLLFLCCVNVAAANHVPYWIENNNSVWIPVDIVSSGETTIYLQKSPGYAPNGNSVFELFDDFTSTTLNTSKWQAPSDYEINNGQITITGGTLFSQDTVNVNNNWITGRAAVSTTAVNNPSIIGFSSAKSTAKGTYVSDFTFVDGQPELTSVRQFYNVVYDRVPNVVTNTNFYTISIRKEPNSVTNVIAVTDSNGNTGTVSGGTSLNSNSVANQYIVVNRQPGLTVTVDDIVVRQYVPSEPTVTVLDMGSYYKIQIQNNAASALSGYQVKIPASSIGGVTSQESILISTEPIYPEVNVSLISPNGVYTNTDDLKFSISGAGNISAVVYINSIAVWQGIANIGLNQINPSLIQGSHSWYVVASATVGEDTVYNTSETWTFTYDTIDPSPNTVIITPDADNIAVGTTVNTKIRWSDTNLDYAKFYVDYGSGFVLEDSITFTSSLQWFNTSIDTTGYIGEIITWQQIAYDKAGNSYIYSDSFTVVLNALNIYVYDEKTGVQILPSNVVVYNEDISQEATVSNTTKVASLTYTNLTTGKYIVNVAADGYYSRRAIMLVDVASLSELTVYLPSETETVIYNTFKIIDNSMKYNYSEMIIRLDKPLQTGTATVFSSYLDFAGTTATYLIATDQYILYIETPDETINYGWLTPDAAGQIDITLNGITIDSYYDDWYTYNYTASNVIVNLDYISKDDISHANFIITNSNTELYNVTSSTKSGSFNYVIETNDTVNVYFELVRHDGATFSDFWIVPGTDAEKTVFPESYPQWLKNAVVTAIAILCILGFSSYRIEVGLALGVGIISIAYIWGEYSINKSTGYTVFLMVFITIIEFILQQRKEARR